MMDLSIVTTMYRSAPYLAEFHQRASAAAQRLSAHYEIILVNDGSPDHSLEVALELYQQDEHVRVVDLSRNFGHHKALMTGLQHATGRLVFLLDSDLEEAPELLQTFHERMQETQADVVYGVQETRKGNWPERISGALFYWAFSKLAGITVPRNVITARLMTQRYVRSLVAHRDREVFLLGLWTITGYRQVPVSVRKLSKGSTTYDWRRKINVFVNAVTSFSNRPLHLVCYLGLGVSSVALVAALYLVVQRLLFQVYLGGWPSLIVSIWMMGGLNLFCLGVIGIYISKVFSETKDRPYTIVRQLHTHSPAEPARTLPHTSPLPVEEAKFADLRSAVGAYYTARLQTFGPTPRGVDWNSAESQTLRFEQLARIIAAPEDPTLTLLDYGCGYGAMREYLRGAGFKVRYRGFDLSESMITEARRAAPDGLFTSEEGEVQPADYCVASGIFNVRLQASDREWQAYMESTVSRMAELGTRGFAFNVLSTYSDVEKRRADLYYADPLFWFDFCKRRFSRFVSVLHDYPLYEFTILVRR